MLYSSPTVYGAPSMPQGPQAFNGPGYGQGFNPYQNGMPMQSPQPQQPSPALKGWPVGSEEEARKAMIDLDGSLFIFPDPSTGAIYTKKINPVDFSPIFRVYRPEPAPVADAAGGVDLSGYVRREDFDALYATVQSLRSALEAAPAKKTASKEADTK